LGRDRFSGGPLWPGANYVESVWVACAKRGQGDSQSGRWLDQLGHIGTEADDALETAQQTEL